MKWLDEAERQALLAAQKADIASGEHPERYIGWYSFTVECVEIGLRWLCKDRDMKHMERIE